MSRLPGILSLLLLALVRGGGAAEAAPERAGGEGVLAGVVQDGAGAPLPGARVSLYPPPPLAPLNRGWRSQPRLDRRAWADLPEPPVAWVETSADAQGRFRLEGLDPTRRVVLVARASGQASAPRLRYAGSGFDLEVLVLESAPTARVRVVDAQGHALLARVDALRPVEGAERDDGPLIVASARTDGEGRAALEGLHEGRVELQVLVEGRGVLRGQACDAPGSAETVLRFGDPKGTRVSGVVTDSTGAPLAGAWITTGAHAWIVNEEDPVQQAWTRTDSDGRWSFEGLSGRRFLGVGASLEGYIDSADVAAGAALAPGASLEVPLVLGREARVRGRTVTSTGEPEAGVEVAVGQRRARSGADGWWEVRGLSAHVVPYGPVDRDGRADYREVWGNVSGLWVEPRPGEVVTVPDLASGPTRALRGRVLDEHGKPVVGAWVAAGERADRNWFEVRPPRVVGTRSGADGTYVLALSRLDEEVSLSAETPDRASEPVSAEPHPGAQPLEVDLHLRLLGRIEARIEDLEGRPAPGVEVRLDGPVPRDGVSDAEGRVRFDRLRAGRYVLKPSYTGRRHKEKPSVARDLVAGGVASDVVLRLDPPRSVSGTVVDEQGRPAVGIGVRLKANEPFLFSDRWQTEETWWNWNASTDGQGRFEFENVAPGDYWIEPEALERGEMVQAGQRDLRLVWYRDALPEADDPSVDRYNRWSAEGKTVRIEGTVLDPQGRPVHAAEVSLGISKPGFGSSWPTSVAQGRFVAHIDADADSLRIRVSQARDASGVLLDVLPVTLDDVKLESGPLEVRLKAAPDDPTARTIRGRVVGDDGRPVAGVVVRAGRMDDSSVRRFQSSRAAVTDAEGWFRLFPIEASTWTVRSEPGGAWMPASLEASTGAEVVVVRLVRGGWIEGRVLDPDRRPVPGVTVNAGERVDDVTSFDGTFRIGPVLGRVKLGMPPWQEGTDLAPGLTLQQAAPLDAEAGAVGVDIVLRRVARIAGKAVDASGRRLGDVHLVLEPEPADPARSSLQAKQGWGDDSFMFADVPPGRWRLTATDEDGRRTAPIVVEAPATEVSLVFDAPRRVSGRLEGADVGGFRAWILQGPAESPAAQVVESQDDGSFTLETEDPSPRRVVVVRRGDARQARLEAVVPGPAPVTVNLSPGERIAGRVEGVASPADPNMRLLTAMSGSGMVVEGVVAPDGTFEVLGLPPGESWRLTLRVFADGALRRGELGPLPGGTEDARIEMR